MSNSPIHRRKFLRLGVMLAGVVLAYGFFASLIVRFLFPTRHLAKKSKMFVGYMDRLQPGSSMTVATPKGETFVLSNTGTMQANRGHSLLAFSNRCPHLGCKVHYVAEQKEFFCPCHAGRFDLNGKATAGPPAQAGQKLTPGDVVVEGNSIYLMVDAG